MRNKRNKINEANKVILKRKDKFRKIRNTTDYLLFVLALMQV